MDAWTVSAADASDKVVADILQHVDEEIVGEQGRIQPTPTKSALGRTTPLGNLPDGGAPTPLRGSQALPAPLNAQELSATPVKDPMAVFSSWVKCQTPNSTRASPVPTGGTAGMVIGSSPMGQHSGAHAMYTPPRHGGPSGSGTNYEGNWGGGRPPFADAPFADQPFAEPPFANVGEYTAPSPFLDRSGMGPNGPRGGGGGGYGGRGGYAGGGYGRGSGRVMPDANAAPFSAPPEPNNSGGPPGGPAPGPGAPDFDPYATSNTASLDSIRGRVYETAKDQHGCRYLQRLLDTAYEGTEAAQIIFSEIVPHVAELMSDQYANFLVQKLFDMMPTNIRFRVAQVAAPYMSCIALTPHGTFSIQKLIETIATPQETEVVRHALSCDVVRLVKDVHGNHVIQKVLQRFDHADKQFIYDAMCEDCFGIATNKQGCCVLQRCLEHASPDQRAVLVNSIVACSTQLVQDPFGNYVVQYVLDVGDDISVNDAIAVLLVPGFVKLCSNKFSSNVMEKMLRVISPGVRDQFLVQLKDPQVLQRLLQDDFGNYVVQTALNVAPAAQAELLVSLIRPLLPGLRNAPYAKKLEAKMDLVLRRRTGGHGEGRGEGRGQVRGGFGSVAHGYNPQHEGGGGYQSTGPVHQPMGSDHGYGMRPQHPPFAQRAVEQPDSAQPEATDNPMIRAMAMPPEASPMREGEAARNANRYDPGGEVRLATQLDSVAVSDSYQNDATTRNKRTSPPASAGGRSNPYGPPAGSFAAAVVGGTRNSRPQRDELPTPQSQQSSADVLTLPTPKTTPPQGRHQQQVPAPMSQQRKVAAQTNGSGGGRRTADSGRGRGGRHR